MAIEFDFATYPLERRTGFDVNLNVERDVADDRTPHVRILGEKTYRTGKLVFVPMVTSVADALESYLIANQGAEFSFSGAGWAGQTFYGYLWSDPRRVTLSGAHYQISVDVYARRGL